MSKYDVLADWLGGRDEDVISASFAEIDAVLGGSLPDSGRRYAAFWSNPTVALPLARVGWRATLRTATSDLEFARVGVGNRDSRSAQQSSTWPNPALVLIGCVKTKRPGTHRARDLYASTLFNGRRRRAESTGAPWYVLSAAYGLVHPDAEIETYDVSLLQMDAARRQAWSERVLRQLDEDVGDLSGRTVEILAGYEYREPWLVKGLRARGAVVSVPLEGLRIGEQFAALGITSGPGLDAKPVRQEPSRQLTRFAAAPRETVLATAATLTGDFARGALDLNARPGAPPCGWDSMPEFVAVRSLRAARATDLQVRQFVTFLCAMDRARDADRLWAAAARLYAESRWPFDPVEVVAHSLSELRDVLGSAGVTQRHGQDAAAWRLIAESLVASGPPSSIRRAVNEGVGIAAELLDAVRSLNTLGYPWFPLLSGPKISVMWVRMLASPGNASIQGVDVLPVAVDVQVRKVTEYLGITETHGADLERARGIIQDAWATGADAAVGPPELQMTAAALDPALWFFGKWGCTFCEHWSRRSPISSVCSRCRIEEQRFSQK